MIKYLKFQLKNAFCYTGFIRVLIVMLLFGIITFVIKCAEVFGDDILSIPSAYQQFFFNGFNLSMTSVFSVILPFAVCAAFSDSYIYDLKRSFLTVSITRGSLKQYYFSKMSAVFICAGLVAFLPQAVNYLLCVIAFPIESTNIYQWDLWQADFYIYGMGDNFLFKDLYIFSPYLYFAFYVVLSSFMSGIIAVIAYQTSFFIKSRLFVTVFMFVFLNVTFRLLEAQQKPFDLYEYIFGNYLGLQTYGKMIIILGVLIITSVFPIPFSLRKLRNCL